MMDISVIYTAKNQRNAKHGDCTKTIKRVANGMLTDRKSRKVGEVGMKAEYIIKIDGEPDIMGNYPLKEKPQELVRCKYCKHRPKEPNWKTYESGFDIEFPEGSKCPCQCSGDGYYSWYPEDDWFCANGEKA